MKATIEWENLQESEKNEIMKDIEEEKQEANRQLQESIRKMRSDNKVLQVLRKIVDAGLPSASLALNGLDALKGYYPIEYRLVSRDPMVLEISSDSYWFDMMKQLPLGRAFGMFINEKRMLKDIRRRSEAYGKIRRFETA